MFIDGISKWREVNDRPKQYKNVKIWAATGFYPVTNVKIQNFNYEQKGEN